MGVTKHGKGNELQVLSSGDTVMKELVQQQKCLGRANPSWWRLGLLTAMVDGVAVLWSWITQMSVYQGNMMVNQYVYIYIYQGNMTWYFYMIRCFCRGLYSTQPATMFQDFFLNNFWSSLGCNMSTLFHLDDHLNKPKSLVSGVSHTTAKMAIDLRTWSWLCDPRDRQKKLNEERKAKWRKETWHILAWCCTLPETNIAPKNGWLEYYFPIGMAYFQVLC